MRPYIDDLDEFDFFDSARVRRLYEKQRHKGMQSSSYPSNGPKRKRRDEDFDDYDEYEDYEDYEDYDEDEFDSYAQHRRY